ncbi:DUF1993 domain-containing protein [Aspergillus affinis]|uniref:DUF1993 domain-containing protein n=1 Tax=Aspergillus affinis TaxID=1070780 RepID=UPI0022FDFBB2|nr:uncharacterized protein KD926_001019 [Aspergillus affinis]KAI9044418.1 hypothetical protein KD926_001019 [Aspergillus affinis]
MAPHTFYDGTIPVAISILKTLSHILTVASQQRPTETTTLLHNSRLHETMYPLTDQVRIVTQWTENLVARLTGRDATTFSGSPDSFSESFERINTVLKSLSEADKDRVNEEGDSEKPTTLAPGMEVPMTGATWAHTVILPNLYFHVTTAFGILRKEGVEIGKRDYYAGFFPM